MASGQRVLITGGSRGLGAATGRRLVWEGDEVLVAARTAPADPVLEARWIEADLSTSSGVEALAEEVTGRWGGVDVLVDNAGASSAPGPVLDRPDEDWTQDLSLNLLAAVRLDRALVPGMRSRGHGVVVHVSSIAGVLPQGMQASYAASKAALNAYSRALATEVGPSGVRVLCVLPGFVATEGATAFHQQLADASGQSLEEAQAELATRLNVPLGRPGRPEDAAELIAFLISDRAGWLTGAQFRVDGGIVPTI